MDSKLNLLFGLAEATPAMLRQQDMVIDETPSGAAIRRAVIRSDSWFDYNDLRDALMTFCLAFVGAMMFLID